MFRSISKYRHQLALVLTASGLCLLVAGGLLWQDSVRQQQRMADLNDRIDNTNRMGVENAEISQLKTLAEYADQQGQFLPAVEYALFHHQWQQAVILFESLRKILANPYLAGSAHSSAAAVHTNLLQLRDAVSKSLANNSKLPIEWQWKLYNLKGNTAVLLAYSVLYHEKDGRKAAKLLSDALSDYKIAIQQVDKVSLSSFERALPRWNLELITAIGEYRRLGLAEIAPADMSRIQEQLQTYIPEAPGFSPGVPAETRVEK